MISVMMKFCFSVYALLSFGANTKKKNPSHQHCMPGCRGRTLGAKVCSKFNAFYNCQKKALEKVKRIILT